MSGLHITFTTTEFEDDATTRAARINDTIGGATLATWLAGELRAAGFAVATPWVEDHGWDFDVTADGQAYLCVCSIEDEDGPAREAHVAISRSRSFWDRLKGTGKVERNDPVAATVLGIVERRTGPGKLELDWFG